MAPIVSRLSQRLALVEPQTKFHPATLTLLPIKFSATIRNAIQHFRSPLFSTMQVRPSATANVTQLS